jgi:signal transduction histidine kinase
VVTHVSVRAVIHADQAELAGVVDNLIENALAYSPPGATVTLTTEAGDDGVGFSVADDGPGIPPEERDQVFDRFYRGGTGRRSGPGTGLGLAIVREVAEKWDGTVEIASSSVGTTVTLRWPPHVDDGATVPEAEIGFTNS